MEYENHKKIVVCYPQPKLDKSQISPKEFLKWAKSDLKKSQDKRTLGNALGNIKKAIHSRIDEIINSTHIVLGSGWDWHLFPTNQKLNILKELGIGRRSIAKIVTEHRNTYEHQYILPSKNTIQGHLDATDLWLDESYAKYFFTRIGLFDLPVYEVITEGDEIKKIVLSNEYKSIIYFWDHKKEYIETAKDKTKTIKDLKAISWEDILSLEKGCIKRLRNKEVYSLSQTNLTKIFNIYNKKAMTRYHGFFKPGIHVAL